ncbi:MAG: hypothetical protein JO142_05265 [Burkholderiales bacterium]|nr:hypothetical protein [Burkholderiales bacterium]
MFSIHFGGGYLVTISFLILDGATILSFVLLCSSFATSSLLPLAMGACYTLIGRSYGSALAFLLDKNGEGADIAVTYIPLIKTIGWIFPDLSQLDVRAMVLYGETPNVAVLVGSAMHAISYLVVMLALACFFFRNREFN